jgi:hypothetical protein
MNVGYPKRAIFEKLKFLVPEKAFGMRFFALILQKPLGETDLL